jgi:hypothetical protein
MKNVYHRKNPIDSRVSADRQRIAVLTIGEQELPLVIGAPQFIGTLTNRESGSVVATEDFVARLARDPKLRDPLLELELRQT